MAAESKTIIYKSTPYGQDQVGYIDADLRIYRARSGTQDGSLIGRVDENHRIYQQTQHDERELGLFSDTGVVTSHGLFEGGTIGWVEPDGVVIQAGLILGEEEVGYVEGPHPFAAGAVLLLLFLPLDAEESKRMGRV
ncbi:hypothetical protein KFU94_48010 [Chloroflexi bacterium TSY]|nr:hypothetical protein [Chloroflexi bacterium TSY]